MSVSVYDGGVIKGLFGFGLIVSQEQFVKWRRSHVDEMLSAFNVVLCAPRQASSLHVHGPQSVTYSTKTKYPNLKSHTNCLNIRK